MVEPNQAVSIFLCVSAWMGHLYFIFSTFVIPLSNEKKNHIMLFGGEGVPELEITNWSLY